MSGHTGDKTQLRIFQRASRLPVPVLPKSVSAHNCQMPWSFIPDLHLQSTRLRMFMTALPGSHSSQAGPMGPSAGQKKALWFKCQWQTVITGNAPWFLREIQLMQGKLRKIETEVVKCCSQRPRCPQRLMFWTRIF